MAINDCDFISPGEFSFCARCGRPETCRTGDRSFNCMGCVWLGKSFRSHEQAALITRLIREQELKGLANFRDRQKLAADRRTEGMVTHGR